MESVGDRLERRARELFPECTTAEAVAARLGVSYETLRKWKSGETGPKRTRVEQLARDLKTTSEWITHGIDDARDEPALAAQDQAPLNEEEVRLLDAFRKLLSEDRTNLLREVEAKARMIDELSERLLIERTGTGAVVRKRRVA